jgi:hypothetical protein
MDGSPLFQLQRSADRWPCLDATTFTASESAIASTGTRNVSTISPAASMTNSASIALSGSVLATVSAWRRYQFSIIMTKLTGYSMPKIHRQPQGLRSRRSTKDSHRLHPRLSKPARPSPSGRRIEWPPSPAAAIWNHQSCHLALAFLLGVLNEHFSTIPFGHHEHESQPL